MTLEEEDKARSRYIHDHSTLDEDEEECCSEEEDGTRAYPWWIPTTGSQGDDMDVAEFEWGPGNFVGCLPYDGL